MLPEKSCARCERLLPSADFYPDKSHKSGLSSYCRSCCAKNGYERRRSEDGWKVHLLCNARTRARSVGVPFDITVDDFEIPEFCPILGLRLTVATGSGPTGRGNAPNSASIDRIYPALGYVPGNIQVISIRANKMKNDASVEELRKFAAWVDKSFPDVLEGG